MYILALKEWIRPLTKSNSLIHLSASRVLVVGVYKPLPEAELGGIRYENQGLSNCIAYHCYRDALGAIRRIASC